MKTLIFHGSLKTLCPQNLQIEADSVAEALSSLKLHPSFDIRKGVKHHVMVEGFGSKDAIYDKTSVEEIHIHPVMIGSGGGGWTQIIIGALIIVAAVYTGGLSLGALGSISGAQMALVGASLMLGGIMQLLAPQPSIDKASEKSRYLSGGKNTVGIGTRIPLIYGTRKAYGHYLSFDIDAVDLNKAPKEWYASVFTSYDELQNGNTPPLTF